MPSQPPRGHDLWTRRSLLKGGLLATTAAGVASCTTEQTSPRDGRLAATADPRKPVVRFALRDSTEGWATSPNSPGVEVSHDTAGWLVAGAASDVEVRSPRAASPASWVLSDRPNGQRLTMTVRIDGPADSYDLVVGFTWDVGGADGTAVSVPLSVPTGHEIDVDSSWTCRGNAPTDVLSRVVAVSLSVANPEREPLELRVRDVRQPPSTQPWGPQPEGIGRAFHAAAPAGLPPAQAADAYQAAVLAQLQRVIDWGTDNQRAIHIGEWAWPKESRTETPGSDPSQLQYAAMAEQWLRLADQNSVPYAPWGESAYWAGGTEPSTDYGSYPDASYYCSTPTSGQARAISEVKPSASLLEDHLGAVPDIPASINIVGMGFVYLRDGTEYSSTNIGVRGTDYLAESPESIAYLYSRGYRVFRLPFRWDRVMRSPDAGELDPDEWGYVEEAIDTILTLPDTAVVIDPQCAGIFWISPDPDDTSVAAVQHTIDGPTGVVTTQMFVDFWLLMSRSLRDRSDRLVFELANEPHDTNPFLVRKWTQAVVSALREGGDDTFCLIPSYPFDNVSRALTEENHPFPWIEDAAGTRRHAYTIHHYMDREQSGRYALSYDDSLAMFEDD